MFLSCVHHCSELKPFTTFAGTVVRHIIKSESKHKNTSVYFIAQQFIDVFILCKLYHILRLANSLAFYGGNSVLLNCKGGLAHYIYQRYEGNGKFRRISSFSTTPFKPSSCFFAIKNWPTFKVNTLGIFL